MKTVSIWETEPYYRMKKVRKECGFTQEQLALMMHMSLSSFKKKENGVKPLYVHEVQQFNKILGVPVDYIVDGSREKYEVWCTEIDKYSAEARKLLAVEMANSANMINRKKEREKTKRDKIKVTNKST